jgi:hypothetical protein
LLVVGAADAENDDCPWPAEVSVVPVPVVVGAAADDTSPFALIVAVDGMPVPLAVR